MQIEVSQNTYNLLVETLEKRVETLEQEKEEDKNVKAAQIDYIERIEKDLEEFKYINSKLSYENINLKNDLESFNKSKTEKLISGRVADLVKELKKLEIEKFIPNRNITTIYNPRNKWIGNVTGYIPGAVYFRYNSEIDDVLKYCNEEMITDLEMQQAIEYMIKGE